MLMAASATAARRRCPNSSVKRSIDESLSWSTSRSIGWNVLYDSERISWDDLTVVNGRIPAPRQVRLGLSRNGVCSYRRLDDEPLAVKARFCRGRSADVDEVVEVPLGRRIEVVAERFVGVHPCGTEGREASSLCHRVVIDYYETPSRGV